MGTPHKHAALIKAWADGAQIQCKDRVWENLDGPGGDVQPGWLDDFEYRIKPCPLRFYIAAYEVSGHIGLEMPTANRHDAIEDSQEPIRGILRIEIDPDTLQVTSAEMEKP